MDSRQEAYGWACVYGTALGVAAAAWQQATADGDDGWRLLFAGFTLTLMPVYFALQWRELRG